MRFLQLFYLICILASTVHSETSYPKSSIYYHQISSVLCSTIFATIYLDEKLTKPLHISIIHDAHHGGEVGTIFLNSHPRLPSGDAELLPSDSPLAKSINEYFKSYLIKRLEPISKNGKAVKESFSRLMEFSMQKKFDFPIEDVLEFDPLLSIYCPQLRK